MIFSPHISSFSCSIVMAMQRKKAFIWGKNLYFSRQSNQFKQALNEFNNKNAPLLLFSEFIEVPATGNPLKHSDLKACTEKTGF
ncbi:hypothetical protein ED312_05460 [Sinomicrobium pectinilyticum]|uniref:Uncharacterized protein n=1 Tax=Sinomicrobium pectinilyticum TaxID=1084421 RepID=A0A3N0ES76_SINP1|nr:hypothetical protein ED312_05460 [Sinomicrobium pectinilyticum]